MIEFAARYFAGDRPVAEDVIAELTALARTIESHVDIRLFAIRVDAIIRRWLKR